MPHKKEIDTYTAMLLRRHGYSWREIGEVLARVKDRSIVFQGQSVFTACKKAGLI